MDLLKHRDAPEPTGDEPDDADFEMPKIYEPVSFIPLLLSLKSLIFVCFYQNSKMATIAGQI